MWEECARKKEYREREKREKKIYEGEKDYGLKW